MAKLGRVPNERFYVRFSTAPMDKVTKGIIEPEVNEGLWGSSALQVATHYGCQHSTRLKMQTPILN